MGVDVVGLAKEWISKEWMAMDWISLEWKSLDGDVMRVTMTVVVVPLCAMENGILALCCRCSAMTVKKK